MFSFHLSELLELKKVVVNVVKRYWITFDGPLVHIWCERCNSNKPILPRWKIWFWFTTSSIARISIFFFSFYCRFTIIFPCLWISHFCITVLLNKFLNSIPSSESSRRAKCKNLLPPKSLLLLILQLEGCFYLDYLLDQLYGCYIQGLWCCNTVSC